MKTLFIALALCLACSAEQLDPIAMHAFAKGMAHVTHRRRILWIKRPSYLDRMYAMPEGPQKEQLRAAIRSYLVAVEHGDKNAKIKEVSQ